MTDRINTYFALLIITIAGAAASMLIIRVAWNVNDVTIVHAIGAPNTTPL